VGDDHLSAPLIAPRPPIEPTEPMRLLLVSLASITAGLAGTTIQASAQLPTVPPDLEASVQRIFASREFAPRERFGPAVWIEQGTAYTTVEPSAGGRGADIVRYQTATGARSIFVPANALIPSGATEPLELEDYALSPDGSQVLVFTNSARVWRQNTRGD